MFNFGPAPDDENPEVVLATFDQGGITLPSTYYVGNDTHSVEARAALSAFAESIFSLLPAPYNATPAASAQSVIAFETALAAISMTNVERRDPDATYNQIGLAALQNLTSSVNVRLFLSTIGVSSTFNASMTNVQSIKFYSNLDSVIANASNTTSFRDYLTFRYVMVNAGLLSESFRNASFAFDEAINGEPSLPPRDVQVRLLLDFVLYVFINQSIVCMSVLFYLVCACDGRHRSRLCCRSHLCRRIFSSKKTLFVYLFFRKF